MQETPHSRGGMIKSLLCTHRSYPTPNTGEDDRLRGGTRPLPMSPAHYLFVQGVYFGVYLPVEVWGRRSGVHDGVSDSSPRKARAKGVVFP